MELYIEPTVAEIKERLAADPDDTWMDILSRCKGSRWLSLWKVLRDESLARNYPTVAYCNRLKGARIQAAYIAMRLDGLGHKLADMFAHQQPPMSNTDREFLEGHTNGSQFEKTPGVGDYYAREAKAQGVDITGAVYINSLAAYPGDPKAWVRGRGDLEAVVKERNWSCQGSSNIKGDPREGPADVRIADDLVESKMIDRMEADPALALKGREDLFQETREMIQPHWAA